MTRYGRRKLRSVVHFISPKKSLSSYLEQYDAEHRSLGNRLLHMLGIPLVWLAVPTLFFSPMFAAFLFVAGLAVQSSAHAVFDSKSQSKRGFDIYYTLLGPVWVASAFDELIGLRF